MSRYVNLDGNTWDGTPISSKIQEVKTRHGYMSGITTGWLYGDNVPHIDLEEYEAKVRADVLDELLNKLNKLSEYARPVGWSNKVEIIPMRTVRDVVDQLKEEQRTNREHDKQSVSISRQLEEITEKICDEFCIYRCTCDDNAECNYIRCGNTCPLDTLL